MLSQASALVSFLWLDNSPFSGCAAFRLSVHQRVEKLLFCFVFVFVLKLLFLKGLGEGGLGPRAHRLQ